MIAIALAAVALATAVMPDRPVTTTGQVQILYQMTGKPIEYVLRPETYSEGELRTPLVTQFDRIENALIDAAEYGAVVKIQGVLFEQDNRIYIMIEKLEAAPRSK